MTHRAAIIGGSVAGLAAAIGLARRGWHVTVVERDLAPDTNDGDEAFVRWDRRNVPQFRQPHSFSARSRNLLLEHVPEVVDCKVVRQDWAWDAAFAAIPRLAAWADPDVGTPLTGVQYMGGHQNMRAHYVVDGAPLVHGLLPVGDSLCTTNPMYGWGASMALTYAFAAVEAATSNEGDPEAAALAYDEAVRSEADDVFRESSAMDRARIYQWKGEAIPEWDRAEVARQDLIGCIAAGALRDPVLGRAQLRRMNLLEAPGAVLDDPDVVEHAKRTQQILLAKAGGPSGPPRGELLEAIAAARPAP